MIKLGCNMWVNVLCATALTISCASAFPYYDGEAPKFMLQRPRCYMYDAPWWWEQQMLPSCILDCFSRCLNFFPRACEPPTSPNFCLEPRRRIVRPTESYILKIYVPKESLENSTKIETLSESNEAEPSQTIVTEIPENPEVNIKEDSIKSKEEDSDENVKDTVEDLKTDEKEAENVETGEAEEEEARKIEENNAKLDLLKENLYTTDIDQSLTDNSI